MSAEADLMMEKVTRLPVDELLALRARIDSELQQKNAPVALQPTTQTAVAPVADSHPLIYKRTPQEIEEFLAAIMTPEELARVGQTDFSQKYIGPKSASEMLIEDREDRV